MKWVDSPLRKVDSPAANVAMERVGIVLKMSAVRRGVNLVGRLR